MPASRGTMKGRWDPTPDFVGHNAVHGIDESDNGYVPDNLDDCATYVMHLCLPEFAVYQGTSISMRELVQDMATAVYVPGTNALPLIKAYRDAENSPEAEQDREHERAVALHKFEQRLKARTAGGTLVKATQRFVTRSVRDPNGVLRVDRSEVLAPRRSFG